MQRRMVVVTIDTVLAMFKDYLCEHNIPANAEAVKLMVKPSEQGKFAIVVESDDWNGPLPPVEVKYHLKRVYGAK